MATDMARTPQQSYWEDHSTTLKRIRNTLGDDERSPRQHKYQPLSDNHPLLQGTSRSSITPETVARSPSQQNGTSHTSRHARGRHSRTPPSRLPRMSTPPDHRHEAKVRGVHFDVLPDVRNGHENGYDSWGENADSDEEDGTDYPGYPSYPYPVVMYPMVLPQPQHRKHKGKKKRVRYRNTPQVMDSRENTIHEPQQIHDFYSTYSYEQPQRHPQHTYDGTGSAVDSPHFSYIAPSHQYDPFDPRVNPVLARYQMPVARRQRAASYSPVERMRGPTRDSPTRPPPETSHNSLEVLLTDLVEEVLTEGCNVVVRDSMSDMVDDHLEKAAVYDIAVDIVNEHMEQTTEDVALDAFEEVFYESVLDEFIVLPEIEEQSREMIEEIAENYNNKKRRTDLRLVKRDTGDRLVDTLCLDYLLSLISRQGKIWTEAEHANKLFDSMILSLLLEQFVDVGQKRTYNINAKPIRRHHEKMATDVAVDVVVEELCATLDEDMADLDEYEMGMENKKAKTKYADLGHILSGL